MYPPTQARPWPYNVRINNRSYMTFRDTEIAKLPGMGSVAPSSYGTSSRDPAIEATIRFERPAYGMGSRIAAVRDPRMYYYAAGADLSCGGLAFLGPEFSAAATLSGQVRQMLEFTAGGTRYLIALNGTRISYSTDGATWTTSKDITAQSPTQATVVDEAGTNYLIVSTTSGEIWQWDGASATTTWTQAGAGYFDATSIFAVTSLSAAGWGSAGIVVMGGGTGGRQLALSNDLPSSAAVPDSTVNMPGVVNWVTGIGTDIYAFLADGRIYQIGVTATPGFNTVHLAYQGTGTYSTDNGRNAVAWGDSVWAPMASGAWLKCTPGAGSVTEVGMGRLVENEAFKGYVTCSVGHNSWFNYFCLYDGTTTYLMKYGGWLNPEERSATSWQFADGIHGYLKVWSKKATAMWVSDIGAVSPNLYLYVGFSDGTLERAVLPAYTPFNPSDSACRYTTSGFVFYPHTDAGLAGDSKILRAFTVDGPILSATLSAQVGYYKDFGASVTALSTAHTSSGQRVAVATGENAKTIYPLITLASNANTTTPVVKSLQMHFSDRAQPVMGPTYYINADPTALNRAGQPCYVGRTAKNIRDNIITDLASAGDVTAIEEDGSTQQLSIQGYHEVRTKDGRYAIQIDTVRQAVAS